MDGGEPHRQHAAVQLGAVEGADIGQLGLRCLGLGDETDVFLAQGAVDILFHFAVPFRVAVVELVDLAELLFGPGAFHGGRLVGAFDDPVQGGHAHAEKLVQVVGVDAQEGQPFEQGYVLLAGLLQDAAVEIHPADISFQIGQVPFGFLFHVMIITGRRKQCRITNMLHFREVLPVLPDLLKNEQTGIRNYPSGRLRNSAQSSNFARFRRRFPREAVSARKASFSEGLYSITFKIYEDA